MGVCGCAWVCTDEMCGHAWVCASVAGVRGYVWSYSGVFKYVWVCSAWECTDISTDISTDIRRCMWDEFSEYLPETRVLISVD